MSCDTSPETIKNIFHKQIKDLTEKSNMQSFDIQFSDQWI